MIKRIVATLAIITGLVVGLAIPSSAATNGTYRHVVIKPDFSTDSACGSVTTTANLEINNYRVSSTRQAYAIDQDGDTATTPDVVTYRVYVDGVLQPSTQNFTVFFNDTRAHTIKGVWGFLFCHPYKSITL